MLNKFVFKINNQEHFGWSPFSVNILNLWIDIKIDKDRKNNVFQSKNNKYYTLKIFSGNFILNEHLCEIRQRIEINLTDKFLFQSLVWYDNTR